MHQIIVIYDRVDREMKNDPPHLANNEREQIAFLAPQIKEHIDGHTVRVLSSTAAHSIGWAQEIAVALSLTDVESHPALWVNADWVSADLKKRPEEAVALVKERSGDVDTVIVVMNDAGVKTLPYLFYTQLLGMRVAELLMGPWQAYVVNGQTKQAHHLRNAPYSGPGPAITYRSHGHRCFR